MTGTQMLPRLVGLDVAKSWRSPSHGLGHGKAVALGLATRAADDPHAAAMELATEIAGRTPNATRA